MEEQPSEEKNCVRHPYKKIDCDNSDALSMLREIDI